MHRLHYFLTLALALLMVSACGSTDGMNFGTTEAPGSLCEMIATWGIDLTVTLGSGLSPSEVQVSVSGGNSAQSLVAAAPANGSLVYYGITQPGTYQVTVSYPGESPKVLPNIEVTSGSCGIVTQSLSVSLP
jgi:hypothetical protein